MKRHSLVWILAGALAWTLVGAAADDCRAAEDTHLPSQRWNPHDVVPPAAGTKDLKPHDTADGSTDTKKIAQGGTPHGRINIAGFWEWIGPPRRSQTIKYINPEVPAIKMPAYPGARYEAVVPDTLDLAERAALAVHGLTAPTDPDADYEIYCPGRPQLDPPAMAHCFDDHVQQKWHEALPLMRLISGSRLNEQVDRRWMEIVVQMQGPDGLLYQPVVGRPWARHSFCGSPETPAEGVEQATEPYYSGRMLAAIALYYELTGDEYWKQVGIRVVDGLAKQAVDKGDYAYFTKWLYAVNEVSAPDAPLPNGWGQMGFAWVNMGLAQFYKVTRYEPALVLSGKLARCFQHKSGNFGVDGRWSGGHFHGHLYQLMGILEYALAANDAEMIRFVRTGYECARAKASMKPIVGYVSEGDGPGFSETCGVADMIALAVKLSAAGVGDYWDDVDRWTRNQFAENQLTRIDWVAGVAKLTASGNRVQPDWMGGKLQALLASKQFSAPDITIDKVAERSLGMFVSYPAANESFGLYVGYANHLTGCCTGNGSRTIYYVWENILSCKDGKLRVNLPLNRASPWADVDSFIPYEGRVDVKIKKASELSVRIPEWVQPAQTCCHVNGVGRPLSWDGRYAVVGKVGPGDVVTLSFPIFERTDTMINVAYDSTADRMKEQEYTLVRKGNDVVHIDPPGRYGPFYQREQYRENKPRTKKVERFVTEQQIEW